MEKQIHRSIEDHSHKRGDRPRRRSKRRGVLCPKHGCYLDSCSPKYYLYVDQESQLRVRGVAHRTAVQLIHVYGAIPLRNEWLEEFWCKECQQKVWYHVRRDENLIFHLVPAPSSLWHQVSGVIDPRGNPSVSEFTRTQSRAVGVHGLRSYRFL